MSGLVTLRTLTVLATGRVFDLNPADGSIRTIEPEHGLLNESAAVSPLTVERTGIWPAYTGTTRQGRTLIISHVFDSAALEDSRARARALYDPKHGECELLFERDGHEMTARVKMLRMFAHSSGVTDTIASGEVLLLSGVFYSADGDSGTDSVAADAKSSSPATVEVTNHGTVDSRKLTLTLEPTAQKAAGDGQRYLLHALVIHRAPRALKRHPIELTGGGWDHAAEVTATRSAADGDDVEAYVGGVREMRWAGPGATAFNQAGTRLWTAIDHPAAREWRHSGASTIADSATSFETDADLNTLPALPFYAAFHDGVAGHEQVLVTGVQRDAGGAGRLTIVRGRRGTTAVSHSAGTSLWWTPVLVDIVYGWTSAPAPSYIDDRFKPLPAESASSGNDAWVFGVFQESEAAGDVRSRLPRPGSWRAAFRPHPDWSQREDMYTGWVPWTAGLGSDSAVASSMAIGYRSDGPVPGHPRADRWELYSGIGISQVDFTQTTATLAHPGPPNEGRLALIGTARDGTETRIAHYAGDGATAESETPAVPILSVAFAIRPWDPTDLADNTLGSDSLIAQEPADDDGFVIDDVTLTFDEEEALTVELSARQNAYQIGRPDSPATLANELGETLSIYGLPVLIDDVVTIDVDARRVNVEDGGESIGVGHVVDGDFPDLPADETDVPHASDLTYTEAGIGTVEIGVPSMRSAWN